MVTFRLRLAIIASAGLSDRLIRPNLPGQQAAIAGLRIAAGQSEVFEQPRHLEDAVNELRAMVEVERYPCLGGAAVQHEQAGQGR